MKRYDHPVLREIIAYVVNPNITFVLPPGAPHYKPDNSIDAEEALYTEVRMLKHFVAVNGVPVTNLKNMKRESLFVDILERVHPEDAKLLIRIKDGDVPYMTKTLIDKTWPGYLKF